VIALGLFDELIDTYLMNSLDPVYFDLRERAIVFDWDPMITGEPGIDWDDEESETRYVKIPTIDASKSYKLMEQFAAQVEDERERDKLFRALDMKKPFRSFKDALLDICLQDDWYSFAHQFGKKEIQEWLQLKGIEI
jgi:hypothetical protein